MAAPLETVAWVKPPEPIRGLDHLGVQAPCIALYGQLLPGITNVTDRARYYLFHPWVVWAFERRYADHSVDEFRRVLRRAECLFALIAIRHARVVGDGDDGLHSRAMVGRDKLLRIAEDVEGIAIEDYATLEGANRYFKNKLGGLGQYYFGPLRDLRVLDHHEGVGYPGYDEQRGRKLAEAFASVVPEALRQALGALEEDPTQLEALLKLTEKVIFDSDDVVRTTPLRPTTALGADQEAGQAPASLALSAAGRKSSARRTRSLASGDIVVLLDALMRRLGEGLTTTSSPRPRNEEEEIGADEEDGGELVRKALDFEVLAKACRGKSAAPHQADGRAVRVCLRT